MQSVRNKALTMILAFLGMGIIANAQSEWPKEIPLDNGGRITIYQPQPENLKGNLLSARAAVSISKSATDEPTFGAIWFDATLQTDKDSRTATLESMNVKEAKFPGIQDQQQLLQYTQTLQGQIPNWNLRFPLDELLTSIQQTQQLNDPNLKNDAPNIMYRTRPSTLVIIDGEPKLQLDKDLNMQKVVNSPSIILQNPDDNLFYLYGGGLWYNSNNILNGWNYVKFLPARIQQVDAQIQQKQKDSDENNVANKPTTPSDIIVSTQPAELIQTEGEPTYQSIAGTSLLYANNSLNDIFKDINTQKNYILVSGRWYTSNTLNGGWTYVPADQLPADFAKIPEGSEKDGVLSSVAGTSAANEALMDAQIPQTAKIDRRTATTNVTYDGNPQFSPIRGTNMAVAENSSITVLRSNGQYFAVDNGTWYVSNNPNGPWQVSTTRPEEVNNIPPDNIAYNTKYVYVYDYTSDYVYTGYTPGYLGCYIYGPTVVWGTGWYYRPWYRHYYYPRAYTWGFGMSYNPWSGWNIGFNVGYSLGWHYYDSNPYWGGWFGPRAYHPPYRPWGFNGGYYGGRNVVLSRPNVVINRPITIYNNNTRINNVNVYTNRNHSINLYNRVNGAQTNDIRRMPGNAYINNPNNGRSANNNPNDYRIDGRPAGNGNFNNNRFNNNQPNIGINNRPFAQPAQQANGNNIATDRQGNVFRRDNNGWQQNSGNGGNGGNNNQWRPAPSTQVPDLNRVQQQRDRSNMRENNFRAAQPQAPRVAPAQAPRSSSNNNNGGGRRRG
jgi:hypothetical protein